MEQEKTIKNQHLDELVNLPDLNVYQKHIIKEFCDSSSLVVPDYFWEKERSKISSTVASKMNCSEELVKRELGVGAKLFQVGILRKERNVIFLSEIIRKLCLGSEEENFLDLLFRPVSEKEHESDEFEYSNEDLSIMRHLLKAPGPVNVLLYGMDEERYLSAAHTLGVQAECKIYRFKDDLCISDEWDLAFRLAGVLPPDSLLLFERHELLLVSKFSLIPGLPVFDDALILKHQNKILWLGQPEKISRKIKKKMDFFLEVKCVCDDIRKIERLKQIQDSSSFQLFDEEELKRIAVEERNFELVEKSLKRSLELIDRTPFEHKQVFHSLLSSHKKVFDDHRRKTHLDSKYDPSLINMSMPHDEVVRIARKFLADRKTQNLNILLWGDPGVGKTAFGEWLVCEALGLPLITKKASDLLDKYVGESEKAISKFMKETHPKFLDEVDNFVSPRETAEKSWVRTMTNELLQALQEHSGIFICSSNMVDAKLIDRAFYRRMHLKLELKNLTTPGVKAMYEKWLAPFVQEPLTDKELQSLLGIKGLNFGDFSALYHSAVYEENLSHKNLIERLNEETKYRQRRREISL